MKKFLFIHDIPKAQLLPDNQNARSGNITQNVGLCWLRCWDWENGESEAQEWDKVTARECLGYENVMLWLLCEPGNGPKYERMLGLLREIRARRDGPLPRVIAYADGPVGWGYQHNSLPLDMKSVYLAICREADYLFCYGMAESMGYWRAVRNGLDVYALDRPHPVEAASAKAIPPTLKRGPEADPAYLEIPWEIDADLHKIVQHVPRGPYVALAKGVNNVSEERGIFCSLAVARHAQDRHQFATVLHTATPIEGDWRPYYADLAGLNHVVEIRLKMWSKYILDLARCYLGVHLDVLETRGQFALDCASLGIPCICSGSVAGRRLFPATYVQHPRDIETATDLLDRLVKDGEFYRQVCERARDELQAYSCASVRRRFEEIVNAS